MEVKIQCLECGRKTMRYEVGRVFYNLDNTSDILFEREVICPKCKSNISRKKFKVDNEFLISLIAANISLLMKIKEGIEIPNHLRGVFPLKQKGMNKVKRFCKSIPLLERS